MVGVFRLNNSVGLFFMLSRDIYVVSATASGRKDVATAVLLWTTVGGYNYCCSNSRMYGYAGPPHYGAVESSAGDSGGYLQPGPIPMAMVMPMPAVCEPPLPPPPLQMSDEAIQKRRRLILMFIIIIITILLNDSKYYIQYIVTSLTN